MKNTTTPKKYKQPSDKTRWAYYMQAIEPTSEAINEAFPGHHPQWVLLSQMRAVTAENFKAMRETMGLTIEQCAAFLRVGVSTIKNWEKGVTPVMFSAFELLRVILDSVAFKTAHPEWDGWFVGRNGQLMSPDCGRRGFTPEQLNLLSFQRSEAVELRIESARLKAKLAAAQEENTRLRTMFVDQGVVDELAAMQGTIAELMTRIATARIIPFQTVPVAQLKEKTA